MSKEVHKIVESDYTINVYLLGSRLWGTNRPDSDYDLFIIIRNDPCAYQFVKSMSVDALIYTEDDFKQEVQVGNVLAIVCMILPGAYILKGRKYLKSEVSYNNEAIQQHLSIRLQKDSDYIMKNVDKGKVDRARKTLLHALIYQNVGHQLLACAENMESINLRVGKQYVERLFCIEPESYITLLYSTANELLHSTGNFIQMDT